MSLRTTPHNNPMTQKGTDTNKKRDNSPTEKTLLPKALFETDIFNTISRSGKGRGKARRAAGQLHYIHPSG